jgi:hypothetical protein
MLPAEEASQAIGGRSQRLDTFLGEENPSASYFRRHIHRAWREPSPWAWLKLRITTVASPPASTLKQSAFLVATLRALLWPVRSVYSMSRAHEPAARRSEGFPRPTDPQYGREVSCTTFQFSSEPLAHPKPKSSSTRTAVATDPFRIGSGAGGRPCTLEVETSLRQSTSIRTLQVVESGGWLLTPGPSTCRMSNNFLRKYGMSEANLDARRLWGAGGEKEGLQLEALNNFGTPEVNRFVGVTCTHQPGGGLHYRRAATT